ncbi:MAG TPA: hypothetical protein VKB88_06095 [Bryobacteraceae bacterium]|nr:hypothetical protein [Bryobacteraceae bacterium]
MTTQTLYRSAAVVFVLFAAGHTLGFLSFTPPTSEGIAVRDAMANVHFTLRGSTFSYGGFYRGFGLSATVSMLFQAFLAWQLAALTRVAPRAAASITWALVAVQVLGFVLSCLYFAIPPAVFSLGLGVLLAFAGRRSHAGALAVAA